MSLRTDRCQEKYDLKNKVKHLFTSASFINLFTQTGPNACEKNSPNGQFTVSKWINLPYRSSSYTQCDFMQDKMYCRKEVVPPVLPSDYRISTIDV